MVDININKLSEALNGKADIDLNNTGVFTTSNGGGGVNLILSTPAGAESKEVVSADFVENKTTAIETTLNSHQEILNTCFKKTTEDKTLLSKIGMPAQKKVVLTLGATDTVYAAPANGYVYFYATYTSGSQVTVSGFNTTSQNGFFHTWYNTYGAVRGNIICKAGDQFIITYNGVLGNIDFSFHYAEGVSE